MPCLIATDVLLAAYHAVSAYSSCVPCSRLCCVGQCLITTAVFLLQLMVSLFSTAFPLVPVSTAPIIAAVYAVYSSNCFLPPCRLICPIMTLLSYLQQIVACMIIIALLLVAMSAYLLVQLLLFLRKTLPYIVKSFGSF